MSEFEFRTTADVDEFATAIWESVGSGVDEKIDDQAWDAVSTQVSELIGDEAWDAVQENVYEAAREAANDATSNSDGVEETLSNLLHQYSEINVGSHCTIGERATALVTKVIQYHLDTSFEDGGLLAPSSSVSLLSVLEDKVAGLAEENALLWIKVNDLHTQATSILNRQQEDSGMLSRLQGQAQGFRAKYDTPEGTLAQAEATIKHILIAVQDARGAARIAEPF